MRIVFLPLALLCLSSYIFAQVANHEPSGDSLSPGPLRQLWEERTQGKNLALGKELLFSSPPSYHLTRSDSDPFDLTDGKLSTVKDDLIWFGKDAVGWFGGTADSGVNLYIDLGKVENIEKLVIRCLGGESQRTLSLPRKLEVYVSRDGQRYYAASSLQKLQGAEKELSDFKQNYYLEESGKAYIYPFELAVNAEARYVGLTIYSYAGGLFSDELAIIEGEPQSEGFNLAYQQSSVPFHISGVLVRPRMDEFVVSSNINTPNFFNIRDMRSEDQAKAPIMLDIDAPAALKVLSPSPLNEAEYRSAEGQKRVKFTMQVKPKAWSNSQVNEIYFSCSQPFAAGDKVHFKSWSEGVNPISTELPIRSIEIPQVPRLKRIHVSLAWMSDSDARAWPGFFPAWECIGFNAVSCFPRYFGDKDKLERDEFFAEARRRGLKVVMNESPIHGMPGKGKAGHEMNCLVPKLVAVCPSYRGDFYHDEVKRIADNVKKSLPDYVFLDIEAWYNSHISAKTCTRCLEAQKKSGMDMDEYCKRAVAEIMKDYYEALNAAAQAAGIKKPLIGAYGQGAGHIDRSQLVYHWDYYYPNWIDLSQPSMYVGERPWLIHQRIRSTHKLMQNRNIIPWLTAGTYGEIEPRFREYSALESLFNGAGGFTYYIFYDFDTPRDYYHLAKALKIIAPYEDLILDGEVIDLPSSQPGLYVSPILSGQELLLLVGNYQLPDTETEISLPFKTVKQIKNLYDDEVFPASPTLRLKLGKSSIRLLHISGE